MRFSDNVIQFKIGNIDAIGNLNNGSIIGLDESGKALCNLLSSNNLSENELRLSDKELYDGLYEGQFFEDSNYNDKLSSAYLHVTQKCNLNCIGCYSLDGMRNNLQDPSLDNIKKSISELKKNGVSMLVISGGEPFLRNDLPEIISHAKEIEQIQHVQIITNGTITNKDALSKIAGIIDGIAISFDGYNKENPTFIRDEGIFDRLVSSVNLIKSYNINVSILPTIHSKNYDKLEEYVKLAKELKTEISFSLLTCEPDNIHFKDYIPSDEQLISIGETITHLSAENNISVQDMPVSDSIDIRKSCEAGSKIVSIGADGTVYPCHMLHNRELEMGNIFNQKLNDIMNDNLALHFKNLNVNEFETCKECRHKYLCGGGCRARSYYKHKSLNNTDYYCSMTSQFFDIVTKTLESIYIN